MVTCRCQECEEACAARDVQHHRIHRCRSHASPRYLEFLEGALSRRPPRRAYQDSWKRDRARLLRAQGDPWRLEETGGEGY